MKKQAARKQKVLNKEGCAKGAFKAKLRVVALGMPKKHYKKTHHKKGDGKRNYSNYGVRYHKHSTSVNRSSGALASVRAALIASAPAHRRPRDWSLSHGHCTSSQACGFRDFVKLHVELNGVRVQEVFDFDLGELKERLRITLQDLDATSSSPLTKAVH